MPRKRTAPEPAAPQDRRGEFHPVAGIFPLLLEPELDALAADIAENGVREAIWRHRDGSIIDGRNRWLACQKIGVEPPSNTYAGPDEGLLAFIISEKVRRQHFTTDQKAAIAADMATREREDNLKRGDKLPEPPIGGSGFTAAEAAKFFAIGERTVERAKELKDKAPDLHEEVRAGRVKAGAARRELKRREREAAVVLNAPRDGDAFRLHKADVGALDMIADGSIDCIITDPPYPQEFLDVYPKLAATAARVLKPGGSCLAMIGQSYLPEILAAMRERLTYHWTIAYLTPGGQSAQLWQRQVNTFWKPVLWLVNGERDADAAWVGDVARSRPNDNDKRFHHWGQSESGMADLVRRFSKPGETILDPFCGAGTTGVVAVDLGRRFVGADIDEQALATTATRLIGVGEVLQAEADASRRDASAETAGAA